MNETPIETAFAYCPRCATASDAPGTIPFRCRSCELTLFFGPVAAVGALIVDGEQRLLMVRRARNPGKGLWGLPGGFVDRGESIDQALRREVLEETSLELAELDLLFTHPNRYAYGGIWVPVIDLFYRCRAKPEQTLRLADGELQAAHWVHPSAEQLDHMAFPSNRLAIEAWLDSDPYHDPI